VFSEEIKSCLHDLKHVYHATALKASFEDEGINDEDLTDLVLLSGCVGLNVAVKIGGAEANSDIVRCLRRGVTDMVAPLVETTYAVSKFIQAAKKQEEALRSDKIDLHVNLETITASHNALQIIDDHHTGLEGVVVGRSDLSKSMGLTKKDVDSKDVMDVVEGVFKTAKAHGLMTTMGGTISVKSVPHICNLYERGLLDRFETRAVVFNVKSSDRRLLEDGIKHALQYEQLLQGVRSTYHTARSKELSDRIEAIQGRKNG